MKRPGFALAIGLMAFINAASAPAQEAPSPAPTNMPAAAGCPEDVRNYLTTAARTGAEASTARVRNTYSRPTSVLSLSCLERFLRQASAGDVLVDAQGILDAILGLGQQAICSAADQAWNTAVGSPYNPANLFPPMPNIPGVRVQQVPTGSGGIVPPDPRNVGVVLPRNPQGVGTAARGSQDTSPGFLDVFR